MRISNSVKFFRRSLENEKITAENTGEQTSRKRSERKKSGCKALHVTQRRAFSTASEDAEKTEQLKALKAALVEEARIHPDEHIANDKGGSRWTAEGKDGCIARVSFPAPTLISELDGKGDLTEQCQAIAGESFRKLFTPVKVYHLAEDFRAEVKLLLPEAKAEELTKLCENEAAPRVSFETAKESTSPKAK